MAALTSVRTSSPSPGFLDRLPEDVKPFVYQFCAWEDFIALFQTSVNSRLSTANGFVELCHTFQKLHPSEIVKAKRFLSPLNLTPLFAASHLEICQYSNLLNEKSYRTRERVCEEITTAIAHLESTNHQIQQITFNYEFLDTPSFIRLLNCIPQVKTVAVHNCVLLGKEALAGLSQVSLRTLTLDGSLHLQNPQSTPNKQLLHRDILNCKEGAKIHSLQANNNPAYTARPFLFSLSDFTGYQNLEELVLRNVRNFTNEEAIQMSPSLSQLKSFTLLNCSPLSLPGVHSLLDNAHLTEVLVINQDIDDDVLQTLTLKARDLQKVEIQAIALFCRQPTELGMRSFLNCAKITHLTIALGAAKITDNTLEELSCKLFATSGAKPLSFRNRENPPARFRQKLENWRRDFESQ